MPPDHVPRICGGHVVQRVETNLTEAGVTEAGDAGSDVSKNTPPHQPDRHPDYQVDDAHDQAC